MARKLEKCIDCSVERDSLFRGNRCRECYLTYCRAYNEVNKARLNLLNKENKKRQREANPKPPRPLKTQLTEEERKERSRESQRQYQHRLNIKKIAKEKRQERLRKPIQKNPDREIYCSNDIYPLIRYHMDFSNLLDCPMEMLTYEYWHKKDEELIEYLITLEKSVYISPEIKSDSEKEYQRNYYKRNRERLRTKKKEWYQANKNKNENK